MTAAPENKPEQRPTWPDWDATLVQQMQLDDLLNQFLDQGADAETVSLRAELTEQFKRMTRPTASSEPGTADKSAPAAAPKKIGPYQVIRPLGSGGMGDVFLARHTVLNRNVALKLLKSERALMPGSIERFRREMQALAALNHPHVVSAWDGDIQQGMVYLAMELVDGIDLKQLVRQLPELPVAFCCELVRQAALGLEAMHNAGIVHRDIKPSNMMLTRDGTVKLLDLGLARMVDERSDLTGQVCAVGTARFMSPEQLIGDPDIDFRSDIFSLGRTLEQLLGWGESAVSDHRHAGHREPRPKLQDLIRHMTASDRSARPASAAIVAERLAEFCELADFSVLTAAVFAHSAEAFANLDEISMSTSTPTAIVRTGFWKRMAATGVTLALGLLVWQVIAQLLPSARVVPSGSGDQQVIPLDKSATDVAAEITTDVARNEQANSLYAQERKAAEWALKHHGKVTVNYRMGENWTGKQINSLSLLPEEPFLIQVIELPDTALEKSDRELLGSLKGVQGVHLYSHSTSDTDIFSFNPAWKLKWLYVPGTDVTDRGVASLFSFRESLLVLNLEGTQVTNESIQFLSSFPLLRALFVGSTSVTDTAMQVIPSYPALVALDLSDTNVTTDGVCLLKDSLRLAKLQLRNLPITDEALAALAKLLLAELDIRGTQISAAAVREFQESHPDCKVLH